MFNFFLKQSGLFVFILMLTSSCNYVLNVTSKNEYLTNYRDLIEEVQENYHDFDKIHWERYDKELNKYSQKLYTHFIDDLTYEEKLEVGKFPILYHLAKYKKVVAQQVDTEYRKDAQLLQKSLREIMDSTSNIYENYNKETKQVLKGSTIETTHTFQERELENLNKP